MKTPALVFVAVIAALTARGQPAPAGGPTGPYGPDQLEQLLAPIALYPDPIVALILPASVFPSEITLARRYLASNRDPGAIAGESWDASVKGLTHYPVLLQWLDDNLEWTRALGQAVVSQQPDVMKAIQDLRARALASGALVSVPQERVVTVGGIIRILPPDTSAIYLPEYDPDVAFGGPGSYQGPPITYGAGYPVGNWLAFDCDWVDCAVWTGPWRGGWESRVDYRRTRDGRDWRPGPGQSREVSRDLYRPPGGAQRPGQAPAGYDGPEGARHRAGPPRPTRQEYRERESTPARSDDDRKDRH
jgi:hypothetical protein